MIAITDYGIGNIGSIFNMLKKTGEKNILVAHDPETLNKADKVILPGVGAFDTAVHMLKKRGFWDALKDIAMSEKKPILGICLGMQLLGRGSEEGKELGLGLLPFDCIKFRFKDSELKVPHMGWDYVEVVQKECVLTDHLSRKLRYYFVHSYYAVCEKESDVLMWCDYGHNFAAAVHRNHIYGTQFHPEKSHRFGMELLDNFVRKC